MSKATIPFAVLIVALFVSATPGFAKGGGNGAGKAFAKTPDHRSESAPTKKKGHASKPPARNASGAGAARPPGDTGNSGGAGAGRPPGYTGNSGGAGAGRPPGDTGTSPGAGAGKS
jgi:hypothetical protein